MNTYFKDIKDAALELFKKTWITRQGVLSISIALAIVYTGASLIVGEWRNPIWIVWWALIGSSMAAFSGALSQVYAKRLKQDLDEKIANPPGFKYVVTTIDDADIGEIDEVAYLKAKYEADTCYRTRILQLLNCLWVAWCIVVKSLAIMPVLLVTAALAYRFFVGDNSLSAMTLGQVIESNLLVISYQISLFLMIAVPLMKGFKNAPGYRNFYELRLRRLLSKELPNIANANGFTVTGYRIDLDANRAEVV